MYPAVASKMFHYSKRKSYYTLNVITVYEKLLYFYSSLHELLIMYEHPIVCNLNAASFF